MIRLGLADDVSALYSHAGVSALSYKSFNSPVLGVDSGGLTDATLPPPDFGRPLQYPEPEQTTVPIEIALEEEEQEPRPVAVSPAPLPRYSASAPSYAPAQVPFAIPAFSPGPSSSRRDLSYVAVDRVFDHAQNRAGTPNRRASRVQPSVLPIFRVAGGAGVTTVLASLARALSIVGERVLMIDSTGSPILPFYFGSTAAGEGEVIPVSINRNSPFEGAMRILQTTAETSAASGFASARAGRNLLEESRMTDRILVAPNEALTEQMGDRLWLNGSCLVVLNPELRVILGLEQMRRSIARHSENSGKTIKPYYVLNRYNDEDHLHRLLKSRLAEQLGDEMLSVSIPAAPEIDEALAGGMTVLDFAPHSPAAMAFLELAEWYRGKLSPSFETISPDWE